MVRRCASSAGSVQHFGPVTISQQYILAAGNAIRARFQLDTGPGLLAPAEVERAARRLAENDQRPGKRAGTSSSSSATWSRNTPATVGTRKCWHGRGDWWPLIRRTAEHCGHSPWPCSLRAWATRRGNRPGWRRPGTEIGRDAALLGDVTGERFPGATVVSRHGLGRRGGPIASRWSSPPDDGLVAPAMASYWRTGRTACSSPQMPSSTRRLCNSSGH